MAIEFAHLTSCGLYISTHRYRVDFILLVVVCLFFYLGAMFNSVARLTICHILAVHFHSFPFMFHPSFTFWALFICNDYSDISHHSLGTHWFMNLCLIVCLQRPEACVPDLFYIFSLTLCGYFLDYFESCFSIECVLTVSFHRFSWGTYYGRPQSMTCI